MLTPEIIAKLTAQYKGEMDAYCAYKELYTLAKSHCPLLTEALEEIMYDEYLHARFIREYMMSKDVYKMPDMQELEHRFKRIDEE